MEIIEPLGKPYYIRSAKGGKYKLKLVWTYQVQTEIKGVHFEHQFFLLEKSGMLTIKAGYEWDGATPSWLVIQTKAIILASLPHDVICQMHDMGKISDAQLQLGHDLFRDILLYRCQKFSKTGRAKALCRVRANYCFWAVSTWGRVS